MSPLIRKIDKRDKVDHRQHAKELHSYCEKENLSYAERYASEQELVYLNEAKKQGFHR